MMRFFAAVILSFLLFGCSKAPITAHQNFKAEVLTQLRKLGSDTSKPHSFDFYLYLPTEAVARQAGQRLANSNYKVLIRPGAKGSDWLCHATTTLTPDTAPLSEIGQQFTRLAQEFHGDFDGWESGEVKN